MIELQPVRFPGLAEVKPQGDAGVLLTFKTASQRAAALRRLWPLPDPEKVIGGAYYFGTYRDAGHYLWNRSMRKEHWPWGGRDEPAPIPWEAVDGKLNPPREVQGECYRHHKDGWTAIAFANRTDDSRPGSNSVFFFEAELTFQECVAAARELFPQVMEKLPFKLVEIEHPRSAA